MDTESDPPEPPPPKTVQFEPEPTVVLIERRTRRSAATMIRSQVYATFTGEHITEQMLQAAAKLFSEHYGTWDGRFGRKGPVKLSTRRLKDQYLPGSATTVYASVTVDGTLAGNVFACRWKHGDKNVCWVTQLVVAREYREMGLASGLLRALRDGADDVYGIMSSHPAACLAAAKTFGRTIEKVDLDFISKEAGAIMKDSPIPYIREAKLRGSVFDPQDRTGLASGVDTEFFVGHTEPLEALAQVRKDWAWPLGDLPDGYEFLVVLPAKRPRSRSSLSFRPEAGGTSASA